MDQDLGPTKILKVDYQTNITLSPSSKSQLSIRSMINGNSKILLTPLSKPSELTHNKEELGALYFQQKKQFVSSTPRVKTKKIENAINYLMLRDLGCSRNKAISLTKREKPNTDIILRSLPHSIKKRIQKNLPVYAKAPDTISNSDHYDLILEALNLLIEKQTTSLQKKKSSKYPQQDYETYKANPKPAGTFEKYTFAYKSTLNQNKIISNRIQSLNPGFIDIKGIQSIFKERE
jgi:hypothetical protein